MNHSSVKNAISSKGSIVSRDLQKSRSVRHLALPKAQTKGINLPYLNRSKNKRLTMIKTINPEVSVPSLLSKHMNSSVDEDYIRLEQITARNSSIRYDWLLIEQQIIELNTKRKLSPISPASVKGKVRSSYEFFQENTKNIIRRFNLNKDI